MSTITKQKVWFVFPELKNQFDSLHIPLELTMADIELTTFLQEADHSTITSAIRTLVRCREKSKDYFFYYSSLYAKSAVGNPVQEVSDCPSGFTWEIQPSQTYEAME